MSTRPEAQLDEKHFVAALLATARRCGYTLTDWELDLYQNELAPLGWPAVIKALREIYLGLSGGQKWSMPSVNDIKDKAGAGPVSDKAIAADVAGRILGAVILHGDLTETVEGERRYRAERNLGELAWTVMKRFFGSWENCGNTYTRDNHGMLFAQLRETAIGVIEQSRKGALDTAPKLPGVATAAALPAREQEFQAQLLAVATGEKTLPP